MYWGLEYSKNGEPLNINQPGLHGMKEDDRGILSSSYDSIMFNGESLRMWVCHHAMTGNVSLASICGDVGVGL